MRRFAVAVLFAAACRHAPAMRAEPSGADATAAAGVADARLRALLVRHWEWQLRGDPVWATTLGDHRFDDQLADESGDALARRRSERGALLAEARALPAAELSAAELSAADRTHLAILIATLEGDVAAEPCRLETWRISPQENPLLRFNRLPDEHRVVTPADARNLLARYRQIPRAVDEVMANLRVGAAAGWLPKAESLRRTLAELDAQLAAGAEWPLLAPARAPHPTWPAAERALVARELTQAVDGQIRAAYQRLSRFLRDEILPHARGESQAGVGALPDGARCYAGAIRQHTDLPLEAAALHQLGRDQLARIHAEMQTLGARRFGTRELPAIFAHLRGDPQLYFGSAGEIENKAATTLAAARAQLPRFFATLPRTACVVRKIADAEAPYSTVAYYEPPHADGSKPGEYFVNLFQPTTRPRHEAAVLAFHESIPGHHLQTALAQELGAIPAFRRHLGSDAFVEGWGLYAERLAGEMGLYTDDADRLGMLDFAAWRAARLVVDTGLHALGWTRAQAVAFLKDNTALPENNIDNEVDRYLNWPGQALAYQVGQLEILKLRKRAETALGARFDLRRFHDAVLRGGAVPLPVLDEQIERFIAETK